MEYLSILEDKETRTLRVIFKRRPRTDILGQKKWQIIPFSACFAVLLSFLIPFQVSASLPVGFQEYYVLGYEEHVWQAFIEIDDSNPPVLPGRICSTVNLVATANYQIVYYDHWEDGYEADLLNPIQATTEVYGDGDLSNGGSENDVLAAGDAINLTSNQNNADPTDITGYVPVADGRDPNDLRYDGGDRIISSGGPINLTHAMWPLDHSWAGGAWEVYSRQAYADAYSYRLPVGENLFDLGGGPHGIYGDFRNVYLQLGAFEDNTTVSISNDTGTVNLTLDRGQTYFSMGSIDSIQDPAIAITINTGTVVRTNKPSQVGLITGADGSFQGRFLNILPHRQWGADYVVPIPRGHGRDDDASLPDASAEVYLFNPNNFPIEIHGYDTATQTSFIVSPTTYTNATVAYSQIRGNSYIPQDSAARFTSADGVFGVVVCADTSRVDYDWGFSGTPSKYLTQDYYVSWAPGDYNTPPADNGSPVWVTPMANSTTFYVDFYENASGLDGIVDAIFTLDVLEQQRIFDPDNDNTGMHIWATDPFAVAWGEDPRAAGPSDPYLDLGVAMLPLQQRWLDPVLTLDKTASPTILSSTDDTVTFTLVAQSYNTPLVNVVLSDTLPTSWTYVPSSTHIIYPDKSTGTPDPTIHDQTLFWDISTDMGFNQSLTLTFQASITEIGSVNFSVYDGFESGDYAGGVNWGDANSWQEWGDDDDHTTGTIHVTQLPPTIAGSYHLRIQGNDTVTGSYTISRSVDLSDFAMPVLHFMRQVRSLEPGDYFYLDTYDGIGWTTALTWTNGSQEFTTIGEAVALTNTTSAIRFRSGDIFDADTALLIDQVKIREGLAISVNQGEAVGKDEFSNTLFNPTDEATVHISPLSLSKSVSSAEAGIGDMLTYTLTVFNLGSTDATNVTIHDAVPTQYVTVQSISNGATIYNDGGGIVALIDTLAAETSDTITFTVTVNDFVENGTLVENRAYVESDQTVKAGSNVVGTAILAPDIEFTKSGPTVAYPGNELTYTISYKNVGGAPATGVTIRDTIPLSTTYISGSLSIGLTPSAITDTQWIKLTDDNDADQGTYLSPTLIITPGITPGIIAPGEAGQIRFGVQLDANVPLGSLIQNWATLDRHLSNPSDTNLVIARISDLLIHKKAEPTVVLPGDTITYTVVYTNVSTDENQTGVYVRASIPDYTNLLTITESADNLVEYSWDNGATWNTTRPITPVTHIRWLAAKVPTDTQVTLGFTVQVATTLPPNTTIESTAYITSENTAKYLSAWIPSNQVQVTTVDLWVEKSVSRQTARIGDPISYTISYGNRGSADVSVQLLDVIPEDTNYIANSIWGTGASTDEIPDLLWNVGTFAASSGPQEIGYAVTPDSDLLPNTTITNVAVLSSTYGLKTSNPVTVTIVHCANLTVTKSSDPSVVRTGDMLTYTIIVSNTGPGYAVGVLVSDTLPANTQFVPGSITLDPPSAGTVGTTPPILASNTTIPAGQHITVAFAVIVAAPVANDTVITNTVSVTSTYTPIPITSLVTTTIHNPILALTKQAGSDWTRRIKLTFTNTAQVEDLVDFPVLVVLDDNHIDYTQTQAGGQDVRFVDPDGTILAHEIEQWEDEYGNSYVWVRVPQIDGGSDSDYIWMYYGNPDIADGQDPESVWDASYQGVWHLAEPVLDEQVDGIHFDSTQNHNTGYQNGNDGVAGMIAGGQNFDGIDDRIQITGLLGTHSDVALSAWANLTIADENGAEVVSLGDYTGLRLDDPGLSTHGFFYAGNDNWPTTSYSHTYAGTGWHHFVYTFDDANNIQKLYVDSLEMASTSHTSTISYTEELGSDTFIGTHGNEKLPFDFGGIIDEVRVSNVARSADWIKAQYASMNDTFIAFGSEQNLDPTDEPGIIGVPFTYTLTVTNTGHGAATHIIVTDTLPDGANYISGGSFISSTGTVSWTISTIPADDSQQVTFIVSTCRPSLLNAAYRVISSKQMVTSPFGPPLLTLLTPPSVNADFAYTLGSVIYFTSTSTTNGGPITDWAWDWGDGDTANGSTASHTYANPGDYIVTLTVTDTCGYTDTTTQTIPIPAPELIVTKSAEPPTVIANETLTYTITVSNTGQGLATGVLVSDTLPDNTSLVAATSPHIGPVNGVITWSLGTLGIDDTRSMTMVVHVDSSVLDGTIISNTAWVSSDQGISASDTITTPVETIADLTVSKSDSPDPVETGETLTYTLTVTNLGPLDAQDVYITDTLPLDVTYGGVLDAPPALWGPTVTPPHLTWYTPTLPADATVTIVFTVTVNAGADEVLTNRAVVTSATTDPVPGNNSAEETTNTTTPPQADFSSAAYTVGESDGTATITVTLSRPSESPITVDYATLGGTATPGDDYSTASGTLNFAPLVTTQTFTVSIIPDLIDEPHETVGLTLTGATNATVGDPATLTIRDDDGPAIIAGTVFSDSNGNGVREAGEIGIPDVLITLEAASPATIMTTTTSASGDYTFTVTITGTYTVIETDPLIANVRIMALLEPIYYFSTTPNEVHVDVPRLSHTYQVDFGDALPSSGFAAIHGTAFEDIDGNGAQDAVELGIPNVTITLNGSITDTTDLYGNYAFSVTATGVHTVRADEPDGYFYTTPEEVHVHVKRMGAAYPVNFGNAPITSNFASIYGTVFKDIDGDGMQDAIDLGISNVLITLDGGTVATTDLYGGYTLSATIAGTHTVSETDLAGYMSTTPNVVTQSVTLNNGYRVDFGDKETCSDDPYEEDDTIEQANIKDPFVVGPVSQGHQFCDDTVDWVRFAAEAYTVYTITTNSWGQWADTALALFSTGVPTQPLAENSDCDWSPANYGEGSSCIVWEAPASGVYYVRATNENGLTGRNTLYNLWIQNGDSSSIYLPLVTRNF